VLRPEAVLGSLFCDIHPNQGLFSPILINSRTREIVPIAKFFDVQQFYVTLWTSQTSGEDPRSQKQWLRFQPYGNFDRTMAPADFGLDQLRRLLVTVSIELPAAIQVGRSGPTRTRFLETGDDYPDELPGSLQLRLRNDVRFKDPVATQEGEITFCAYNGGRWRKIVEHLHQTANLAEWNRMHGRHPSYANVKRLIWVLGKERSLNWSRSRSNERQLDLRR